jgi:UDP-glucose 4-epimerase
MVIPTFVQQALAGEAITVFGDGTQSRSFTHVADVVGAVIKLVNEPRAIGQVVNIGSTQETTIGALAGRIRELSGSESTIKFIPYDEAYELGFEDMPRRIPDLSRIKSLIGYEPIHSLDDVLCDVIGHFRRADPARILGCAKQTHEIAELRSDHLAGGGIDCVR